MRHRARIFIRAGGGSPKGGRAKLAARGKRRPRDHRPRGSDLISGADRQQGVLMQDNPTGEVTRLLKAWCRGDAAALERLAPMVEEELRRLASLYLRRESAGHTLQPTALVNEAYLRLLDWNTVEWRDRAHFLAVAAKMMRRILVNHAVAAARRKRGGSAILVS